jgi:hypothetical protein
MIMEGAVGEKVVGVVDERVYMPMCGTKLYRCGP